MCEAATTTEQQEHQQDRGDMRRSLVVGEVKLLDVMVHLNALLPCLVVWWTLAVLRSAWLAVILYETVCLVGLPLLTLSLRSREESRMTVARLRPLIQSLAKPQNAPRCALVTTGSLCLFGLGGFAAYLAACQKEFEVLGISSAVHEKSSETGLGGGYSLVALGVWFCTVNPVLEELFWRGYCYTEFGKMFCSSSGRREHNKERGGLLLQPAEQTAATRWLLSCYFGSFHAVVVALFVSWIAALVSFLFLAGVSRLWIWLAEHPPFGFPFVVAFHAGADVAVVLVFTALDFGWATKTIAFTAALTASILLALFGALLLALAWRHEPEIRRNASCCLATSRTFFSSSFGTGSSRTDDPITTPLVFMPEPPSLAQNNNNNNSASSRSHSSSSSSSSSDHRRAPPATSTSQIQDRLPSP